MKAFVLSLLLLISLPVMGPTASADHWPPEGTCAGYWRSVYLCWDGNCVTLYRAMQVEQRVCLA